MMTYLVIGLCLFLLIVVVYISAKPISMGIEARRNIKDTNDNNIENLNKEHDEKNNKTSISDEILKLNKIKNKGILSAEEYKKAKDKLIN